MSIEVVTRLLRPSMRRMRRPGVRGRRATFRPLRDDSLRRGRWIPLGG